MKFTIYYTLRTPERCDDETYDITAWSWEQVAEEARELESNDQCDIRVTKIERVD